MDSWMNCSAARIPASDLPKDWIGGLASRICISSVTQRYECPKTVQGVPYRISGRLSVVFLQTDCPRIQVSHSRLSVNEHYAAEQMYIDFCRVTDLKSLLMKMTGEMKKAEVFVAILPFSHYTTAKPYGRNASEDLIKACENAIQYFEGVPAAIVPDNLEGCRHKKRPQRTCHQWWFSPLLPNITAVWSILLVCVTPRTRLLVENAVKLLYRSILPWYRGNDIFQFGGTQYRHPYFPCLISMKRWWPDGRCHARKCSFMERRIIFVRFPWNVT